MVELNRYPEGETDLVFPQIGPDRFPDAPLGETASLRALRMAEQLPQVKEQDHELRSLDMPGLNFRAVWHSTSKGTLARFAPVGFFLRFPLDRPGLS